MRGESGMEQGEADGVSRQLEPILAWLGASEWEYTWNLGLLVSVLGLWADPSVDNQPRLVI